MLRRLQLLLIFLPTVAAAVYFLVVASDRYVSEAQFVVRTASKPVGTSGIAAFLQMSGLGRAQDEVYAVQAFISSRTAVDKLLTKLPLREIYGAPSADMLARYPSLLFGPSNEEFHRYLKWMIRTVYRSSSGITTLRVHAFTADDAQRVAVELLDLSELMVNELNERIRRESVRAADAEVKRYEGQMIRAQQEITQFRNAELMIDPAGSSVVITELIGRLGAELSQTEAQIREISTASETNPQLHSLRGRVQALQTQISRERERISSTDGGLAQKLAIYERLVLNREFAKEALATAVRSLETAHTEARRQQLYLERIVEPHAPDSAMAPDRMHIVLSVAGLNIVVGAALWLAFAGWREHASEG